MISIPQKMLYSSENKVYIIIPAYNEEATLASVIADVKRYPFQIIVVDDGSHDRTCQIAKDNHGVKIFHHIINRGLGGALATGIQAALANQAEIIVTFDADGQHKAGDLPALIDPLIKKEADVVIGSRFLEKNTMPLSRRLANHTGNLVTFLLFGIWVSDSQSGLRAFNKKAAGALKIETRAMEVSTEIIKEIKNNRLRLKEIPIKPIYTDYSLSKGQNFFLGLKTLLRLIIFKFK